MITNHVTDYKRSKKLAKYLPQEGGLFYWVESLDGTKDLCTNCDPKARVQCEDVGKHIKIKGIYI